MNRSFVSLYIGGGTPSALSGPEIERLITILSDNYRFDDGAEFTAEVNPGSITAEKLYTLRKGGVTRLSIGVQSFTDSYLQFLGRPHSARQSDEAFRKARAAGFENIGLDLIFGIPGQSLDDWRQTLQHALDLEPEHISAYALSVEQGTVFDRLQGIGKLVLPSDDRAAEMFELSADLLERAGFEHYEISNFARPGHECFHNLNYWRSGDYLGLGPSAWSNLGGARRANAADLGAYAEAVASGRLPTVFMETITAAEAAMEYVLLGLRTSSGIEMERLHQANDSGSPRLMKDPVEDLMTQGLALHANGRLRLTRRGMLVADKVAARLAEQFPVYRAVS